MAPAASRAPALLSARVSLIRLWSSASPPSFPRLFPCPGAPFSPQGPSGRFPHFLDNTEHSDFLPPLARHSVSFARRYCRAPWVSFPQLQDAPAAGLGLFTGIPTPVPRRRRQDLPGSRRTHCERALLFDPGGTSALDRYRASMLPSAFSTASAPARTVISELNHTAQSLAVYASQGGLPHRHARLASGWLASLSARD
jgi:hypothetical protein